MIKCRSTNFKNWVKTASCSCPSIVKLRNTSGEIRQTCRKTTYHHVTASILQYRSLQDGYARKATNKKNNVFKETLRNRWCTGVSIVTLKPFILYNSRLWQPLTSQLPSNLRPTVRISSRNLQCQAPGTIPAKPQSESSTDTIAQLFQWGTFPSWGAVLV